MWRGFVIGLLCLCILGLGICVAQTAVDAIRTPLWLLFAAVPAGLAWFCLQLMRLGDGLAPDRQLAGVQAMQQYAQSESAAAAALRGR